jgi:hypothetical protein
MRRDNYCDYGKLQDKIKFLQDVLGGEQKNLREFL